MDKWISINDAKPDVNRDVLIYQDYTKWGKKGRVIQARTYYTDKTVCYGGPNSLTGKGYLTGLFFAVPAICNPETVTHWQYLPKPPKN